MYLDIWLNTDSSHIPRQKAILKKMFYLNHCSLCVLYNFLKPNEFWHLDSKLYNSHPSNLLGFVCSGFGVGVFFRIKKTPEFPIDIVPEAFLSGKKKNTWDQAHLTVRLTGKKKHLILFWHAKVCLGWSSSSFR